MTRTIRIEYSYEPGVRPNVCWAKTIFEGKSLSACQPTWAAARARLLGKVDHMVSVGPVPETEEVEVKVEAPADQT